MSEIRGHVAEGYGPVADAFATNFRDHGDVGAGFCLYVDGEEVVNVTGGLADPAAGRPYDADTLQLVFSSTKGAAAICVAMLVADGVLDYDTPVAELWPEFGAAGKDRIPLAWIMSHKAGLASVDDPPPLAEVLAVTPIVDALAAQTPLWEPGTRHGYHALTYGWLVGEIVRRVTGRSLGTVFRERVAEPLGLDFWIGLPAELEDRVAPLIPSPPPSTPEEIELMAAYIGPGTMGNRALTLDGVFALDADGGMVWNTREVHASEIPAANGITNARSLARMYAATLGEVDGVRLLGSDIRDAATECVTSGPDLTLLLETHFGMGFMLPDEVLPLAGPRSYGHAGAGGSLGYADPDLGIAYGYVMNQMGGSLVGDPRTQGLTDAVRRCVS
ncbi:MAG: class A beta-lactamase-related serine hydrolase [Actinomyces sp.]|nr:MAG: class A beta-lactamase-related serine hydrolase [Actinomyces sp.]